MEEIPHRPEVVSPARLSDRPPPPPGGKIVNATLIALFALVFSPILFIPGCIFLGATTQMAIDHLNGPLRLEKAVQAVSSDGKTRFEAETNGRLRLIEVSTGQVRQTLQIPVEDFRSLEATWDDNQRVTLSGSFRYQAMATGMAYRWDRTSGALTDYSSHNPVSPQTWR